MKIKFMSARSFIILIFLFSRNHTLVFSQTFTKEINENEQIILIDKSTGKQINDIPYDVVDSFYCGLARVRKGLYFGYINKNGVESIPCDKYIEAGHFNENIAPVATGMMNIEKNGELKITNKKYGMINLNNEIIIPFSFKDIGSVKNNMIAVQDNLTDLWGFIDKTGKWAIPSKYIHVSDFNHLNLSIIQTNDRKYGVINKDGKYVAEPVYYYIGEYHDKRAKAAIEENKEGYLDENGQIAVEFKYAKAFDYSNGFAKVMNNQNLYGYLDNLGKEIIPIEYQYIHLMQKNGRMWAQKNFKFGVIDMKNQIIIPFDYDMIVEFDSTKILASKGGLWGLYSLDGVERIPTLYESIELDSLGFSAKLNKMAFKYNAEWRVIKTEPFVKQNLNGRSVQNILGLESLNEENRVSFSITKRDDLLVELIEKNNQYGLRNKKTKEILLDCKYDSIKSPAKYFYYSDFTLLAFKNKKIKLISVYENDNASNFESRELKIKLLPESFDIVQDIQENQRKRFLIVGKKDKYGIVSLNKDSLSNILPIEFDNIGAIGENVISVKRNGFWGLWDYTKKILLLDYQYEKIGKAFHIIAVKKEGKWGFLNQTGNKMTDFIYEDVSDFFPLASFALVKKSKKWGIINDNNTVLLEYIADNINEPPYSEHTTKMTVRIADMIFNLNIGSIGYDSAPIFSGQGEYLYEQPYWAE